MTVKTKTTMRRVSNVCVGQYVSREQRYSRNNRHHEVPLHADSDWIGLDWIGLVHCSVAQAGVHSPR